MEADNGRLDILRSVRSAVIKVGSAVLNTGAGLSRDRIWSLAEQIAGLNESGVSVTLVSSGAVAAGRKALSARNLKAEGMAGRQGAAAIGQGRLMREYEAAFAESGLLCAQILLTRDDLRDPERFLNVKNTFSQLHEWGVIPIVNENDTVAVNELKFGDNDSLSSLLLNIMRADLCINLTSAPGVYAENPGGRDESEIPVLKRIRDIEALDITALCGGKTDVGTGGMFSKLRAARRAAQLGVPSLILPGREENILKRAFAGEDIGTWVDPSSRLVSSRKYRMAYQNTPEGSVDIDGGAYTALRESGGSLLPGGIVAMSGEFGPGALIAVRHAGKDIGAGLTNYSSDDLAAIMGKKRHEVAAILGDAHYPEVIHRDNLRLDAAL